MAENVELEALDQLISLEGWQRFRNLVAEEWGTPENGGGSQFLAAVKAAAALNDADATAQLRQIIVAQREIHKIMEMIPQRVAQMKRTKLGPESDAAPLSRRGAL